MATPKQQADGNADAPPDLFVEQPITEQPGIDTPQVPSYVPPAEDGTGEQEPGPGEAAEPKNDPRRFEYHQSRADKAERRLKELEQWAPVVRYIQENPKFLDVLEEDIRSKGSKVNQGLGDAPKPPERPKKPADYKLDDVTTPGTASWQYQQDLLEFSANVADYQVALQAYNDKRQEAAVRAERARTEQARQFQELAQEVQLQHGLTPQEAEEFLEYYTNPRYKTHQLVQLFRMNKNQAGQRTPPPPSPFGPPPPGANPGQSQRLPRVPESETQRLNEDFLAEYRRMRGLPPRK